MQFHAMRDRQISIQDNVTNNKPLAVIKIVVKSVILLTPENITGNIQAYDLDLNKKATGLMIQVSAG